MLFIYFLSHRLCCVVLLCSFQLAMNSLHSTISHSAPFRYHRIIFILLIELENVHGIKLDNKWFLFLASRYFLNSELNSSPFFPYFFPFLNISVLFVSIAFYI